MEHSFFEAAQPEVLPTMLCHLVSMLCTLPSVQVGSIQGCCCQPTFPNNCFSLASNSLCIQLFLKSTLQFPSSHAYGLHVYIRPCVVQPLRPVCVVCLQSWACVSAESTRAHHKCCTPSLDWAFDSRNELKVYNLETDNWFRADAFIQECVCALQKFSIAVVGIMCEVTTTSMHAFLHLHRWKAMNAL